MYAKPPFGGPEHVLHYLARYTHRVAISNHRLVNVTDDGVTFRWKDYAHGSQARTMTISPMNSSVGCACTCFHAASSGFGSTDFWPRAAALVTCRCVDASSLPAHSERSSLESMRQGNMHPGRVLAVEQ